MKDIVQHRKIRIGSGAGFSGDRIDSAVELVEKGNLDYLVFECLAERTIAKAQKKKLEDPDMGYDPLLEARLTAVMKQCIEKHIKVITNMGAANALKAAEKAIQIAETLGIGKIKVAAVLGDDVVWHMRSPEIEWYPSFDPINEILENLISANAYTGIKGILHALEEEADIIITGRVADPSLFLAPAVFEYNWDLEDYELLGKGISMGHLLECAGQISGGYFADPGYKDVVDLSKLGFPFAEIDGEGNFVISKVEGSGGLINALTCKEQLIYEIHDPAQYMTPDVNADFSKVEVVELSKDTVMIKGGAGAPPSDFYKVSVGYDAGWTGWAQICYGGETCLQRANLSIEILKDRLKKYDSNKFEVEFKILGHNALFENSKRNDGRLNEVAVMVSVRSKSKSIVTEILQEVEALYTNGPSGGGGVFKHLEPLVSIQSALIPKKLVNVSVKFLNYEA